MPRQGGKPERDDSEYERTGVSTLFMIFAPLAGWRQGKVTDRRTRGAFAHCLNAIGAGHCSEAAQIVLVSDTLNTPNPAALSEAFAPAEARRLREKLEWHYPPKPGRWLDMAESALRVLQRHCLDRRIPDQEPLKREVTAWERERTQHAAKANWRFPTQEARSKLKKLYPSC